MLAEVILKEKDTVNLVDDLAFGEPEYKDELVGVITDDDTKRLLGLRQRLYAERFILFADDLTQNKDDVSVRMDGFLKELKQNTEEEDHLDNTVILIEAMMWAEIRRLMPKTRPLGKYKICRGLKVYRVFDMEEMMDRLRQGQTIFNDSE